MNRPLLLWMVLASASSALAAEDLGAQVAQARAEVDELAADLEAERAASREELAALARRKTELEGELDLLRRTLSELAAVRTAREQASAAGATEREQVRRAVLDAAMGLRRHIEGGLPFRVQERLARVGSLEDAATRGVDAATLGSLEALLVDELTLTTTTERVRHPVQVAGAPAMAEVVRIGMAYMVFRDAAGNAGVLMREEGGALLQRAVTDPGERARISMVMDAMKRGTAMGPYLLPFPESGVKP